MDELNKKQQVVHIRFVQRNGRKSDTFIENLDNEIDKQKMLKSLKKGCSCSGTIKKTDNDEEYIMLTGDQRDNVLNYLVSVIKLDKDMIIMH
jgi:translation initiation factor SUI1